MATLTTQGGRRCHTSRFTMETLPLDEEMCVLMSLCSCVCLCILYYIQQTGGPLSLVYLLVLKHSLHLWRTFMFISELTGVLECCTEVNSTLLWQIEL